MTLFKKEDDDYYKPIRVGNFQNNDYIEYEKSGHRSKKTYQQKNTSIKLNLTSEI